MLYDCLVIGGGPAGLAATVYLARQKIKFLMLTGDVGGQTLWSSDVENYLGFHLLNGQQLVEQFRAHLKDYRKDFELKEGERVERILRSREGFEAKTSLGSYWAKTILVATGTKHRELGVPGEKEFYGKGVTYCATCDAPVFRDKTVHVVGGGNSAMDAAIFLAKYAKQITILTTNPDLMGDAGLIGRCKAEHKIRILGQARTRRILGGEFVNDIVYADAHGEERTEPTQGVFIEVGVAPVSGFIDFVAKNANGEIVVDKHCATSVPGVWSAGDVTDVGQKQIAVAVGEGSKAALEIIQYLQRGGR